MSVSATAHPELVDATQTAHAPGMRRVWRALRAAGLIYPGGWCLAKDVHAFVELYDWGRFGREPVMPKIYGHQNVTSTLTWLGRKGYAEKLKGEGVTWWRAV